MKRKMISALALAFAVILYDGEFHLAPIAPQEEKLKRTALLSETSVHIDLSVVIRIVDGDTIVVETNGVQEKIRMIGVDTPEVTDPRKPVQCFGKEASVFTKDLLANMSVRMESDPTQGDRDKYGRLLRYVFLADGTLVNKLIIAEGYGHEYTYRIPYHYQADFKATELTTREQQKGLWAPDACAN